MASTFNPKPKWRLVLPEHIKMLKDWFQEGNDFLTKVDVKWDSLPLLARQLIDSYNKQANQGQLNRSDSALDFTESKVATPKGAHSSLDVSFTANSTPSTQGLALYEGSNMEDETDEQVDSLQSEGNMQVNSLQSEEHDNPFWNVTNLHSPTYSNWTNWTPLDSTRFHWNPLKLYSSQ